MSSEPNRDEKKEGEKPKEKRAPHLEIAYGSITQDGGSLDLRIAKGVKKARGLGLAEGDDVLMLGLKKVGMVVVPAPAVVTGTNMRQVLDKIKDAIDDLRRSYDDEAEEKTRKFLLNWAGEKAWETTRGRVTPLRRRKKKRTIR